MPLDHWLPFVAASAILLAIPGPTVLLVISTALGHGRRAAVAVVAGVALGDATSFTASMLGLGAMLATSALLFTILRWIGGAYLVYLGVSLWRAPVAPPAETQVEPASRSRVFAHAFAVTALNPKGIVFFVAFVPQFVTAAAPFVTQVAVLGVTFVTMAALNAAAYGLLAGAARRQLREPGTRRLVNRAGGALLVGAGTLAAGWR